MDDWDADDWELDDWEEDSFDEDEWDETQAHFGTGLLGVFDDEEDPDEHDEHDSEERGWGWADSTWDSPNDEVEDEPESGWSGSGGGGAGFARTERAAGKPGARSASRSEPTVSAWDVGAGFALAGWLLDRHADRIERAVTDKRHTSGGRDYDALPAPPPPHPQRAAEQPQRADPVAAPTGGPIDWSAAPLEVGEAVTRSALAVRLAAEAAENSEIALTLEPPTGLPALRIVVIVTALTPPHRLWVVVDEHAEGFATARLLPVFATDGQTRRAIHRTMDPAKAVDAVEWAYAREGVALSEVRWRPPAASRHP